MDGVASMNQKCVRCIVHLRLHQVVWRDERGRAIHLEGPPVFLRACVLGQLQHSRPTRPLFPITVDEELLFDRVYTNCRNPALFPEIVRESMLLQRPREWIRRAAENNYEYRCCQKAVKTRGRGCSPGLLSGRMWTLSESRPGEHAKLELIQINDDYKGGKILARFECPAHCFLFPDEGEDTIKMLLREVEMNKSRNYQCPPRLIFTTSTILTDAVVQSPIDQIHGYRQLSTTSLQSTKTEQPSHACTPHSIPSSCRRTNSRKGARLSASLAVEEGATSKFESTFERAQDRLHSVLSSYMEGDEKWHGQSDSRVKCSSSQPKLKSSMSRKPHYSRTPADGGHSSKIRRTRNKTPGSAFSQRKNVTFRRWLSTSITAATGPHKWEACPRRSPTRQRRVSSAPASPTGRRTAAVSGQACRRNLFSTGDLGGNLRNASCSGVLGERPPFVVRHADPKALTKRNFCGERSPLSGQTSITGSNQGLPGDDSDFLDWEEPLRSSSFATRGGMLPAKHSPPRLAVTTKDDTLIKKYLLPHPGNTRYGLDSPSKIIEQKLERMLRECCAVRRDASSLGEDSLSEDGDRLRASMAAEREETLNQTARMLPDDSLLVRLGPRDYWSQRAAEFTGRSHRLVFDETMERVYNRIYRQSVAND